VRMRSSLCTCALPVRPVRTLKAVLLENSLKLGHNGVILKGRR